jgi:2-polyprenyl-6-hydroxyphenyl methylase/3-demethylubiquinone-9 3-methyltransferase
VLKAARDDTQDDNEVTTAPSSRTIATSKTKRFSHMNDSTLNLDTDELAKFAKIAAQWWDPNGPVKTLHQINPLRLQYIQSHCPLQGKSVIDIGCGGGILSESMAKAGANVTGIDMNQSLIDTAKLHQLESRLSINYLCTTAESIAQTHAGQFDVVTCLELLEHVPDPASVIKACKTLLKPGGAVFFSTINRNPKAYLLTILGAEYILKLLPKNTHDYAKFIKPSELSAWCRTVQLEPQHVHGMSYNPLTKIFRLTPDVSMNYLFYAKRAAS